MSSREPFDDLEAELLALGELLDVPSPQPSDVAAAVRARLADALPADALPADGLPAADPLPSDGHSADPERSPDPAHGPFPSPVLPQPRRPARRARRTRWRVVAAVVVVVIAITAATPQGRAAVRTILRFAGIEFRIGDTTPEPVTTTAPMPGEHPVPTAEVTSARFGVKTLTALGPPQRATVADGGRVVSMFWPGGVRLDQFDGGVDPILFKKLGPPGPDWLEVGVYDAWWVPGEHPLGYIRRQDGTEVPLRQAGPTLIWQQETLGLRLEGVRTREEAVRIAGSLR
ncbi:hypothetical protein [Nonomuraea sp. NPDC002799]